MHSFAVSLGTGHASVVVLRQSSVVIGYAYALVLCGCVSWFYSWTPQRSNQRHRVYSLLVFDVKTSTLKKKRQDYMCSRQHSEAGRPETAESQGLNPRNRRSGIRGSRKLHVLTISCWT